MKTQLVIAIAGLLVPMEDKPRSYINDAQSMTVPDTSYYQRRISDGDLLIVDETSAVLVDAKADTPTESTAASVDAAPADGKKSRASKTTGD